MCKFAIPQVDVNATADERRKAYFDAMYSADLSEEIEKKNNLSYISWSQMWKVLKQFHPSATYKIYTNPATGAPYWVSETGVMVHTSVTVDGLEYENWMPVMDYQNRSMKTEPYTVDVWDKQKKQYFQKTIAACTSFEINASIQRSIVKCASMHGLGLCLYMGLEAGEDLSDNKDSQQKQNTFNRPAPTMKPTNPAPTMQTQASTGPTATLRDAINATTDVASLVSLYLDNTAVFEDPKNIEIKNLLSNRKKALQSLSKAA